MKLYEKIYYCRKKCGLSQEALAERIGVSRQAVSKWETGEAMPEVTKLAALSKEFGVTADFLLSEEEPEDGDAEAKEQTADTGKTEESGTNDGAANDRGKEFLYAIPGFVGRLFRKYGWLGGVYLAVSGAMFTGLGALMRFISNLIFGSTVSVEQTQQVIIDGAIVDIPVQTYDPLVELPSNLVRYNPVSIIGGAVIVIGVVMMIGGTVLAVWLKKKSR